MSHVNPYRPRLGGDPNVSIILALLAVSAAMTVAILFLAVP